MARKKVRLRYIENAATRRACFKKRRQSLLKKVEELSILCDVLACIMVYSEDPTEPPVHWPENRTDVEQVLLKLQSCPDIEQRKKMSTQESYIRERIEKLREQLKKLRRTNHEMEMFDLMQLIYLYGKNQGEFTTNELKSLRAFTEEKISDLERRAEFVIQTSTAPPTDEAPPPPQPPPTQLPPPPHASPTSTAFERFVGMFQQGDQPSERNAMKDEVPHPPPSEGGSRGGLVAASTLRFPQGNFEVGGGSGTRNDPNGDGLTVGHGTLLPIGPTVAGGGGSGTYGLQFRNPNTEDASGMQGMAFPYVAGPGGYAGSYAVNPYRWSTIGGAHGTGGSNIGGPGFIAGQATATGVVGLGYANVGPGYANVGPYGAGVPHIAHIGEIPGGRNPIPSGVIGGPGYLIQAPPENVPGASSGSTAPARTGSDADSLSQGGGNNGQYPRSGGTGRGRS